MAAPAVVARVGLALLQRDDFVLWALLAGASLVVLVSLPLLRPILGFGAILALFGGLTGAPHGGGPVSGGAATTVAVSEVPADQLALMQQVANSAPCSLPWTVLAQLSVPSPASAKPPTSFLRRAPMATASSSQAPGRPTEAASPGAPPIPPSRRNPSPTAATRRTSTTRCRLPV
jgi:hypothetical protein